MPSQRSAQTKGAIAARRKFLNIFPGGFSDEEFIDLERSYQWKAHLAWQAALPKKAFAALLRSGQFDAIAAAALRIDSKTNLLFSFEKIALRDAVRTDADAKLFCRRTLHLLYGRGNLARRIAAWVDVVTALPRHQTRVLTWPVVTVFGFIACPKGFFFYKPTVTREAARRYGFELPYRPRPSWDLYRAFCNLCTQ